MATWNVYTNSGTVVVRDFDKFEVHSGDLYLYKNPYGPSGRTKYDKVVALFAAGTWNRTEKIS